MTKEEKINKVKELRRLLTLVQNDKSTEKTREKIYQLVPIVSPIMEDLGTLQTMTVGKYGVPDRIVNPIENIFQVPYGMTYEVRSALIDMLNKTIGVLQSKEEISKSVKDNIWSIMHPEIIRVAQQRFESEQYADAVEAAFKEINTRVKNMYLEKDGETKDGADLMFSAFPANNPVLCFDFSTSPFSKDDIQKGYMHMFAGAMMGIRNPKAHANEMITNEDALRKLAFASMLMYKLDTVVE
jgi:uncharacterized protein (TIGR02391 family)